MTASAEVIYADTASRQRRGMAGGPHSTHGLRMLLNPVRESDFRAYDCSQQMCNILSKIIPPSLRCDHK